MIGTYHGARMWCNLDGCGILCAMATWGMLLYSVYVVVFVVLRPTPLEECLSASRVLVSLAFAAVAGLAVTAHVRTMLTDPGAVPRHANPVPASGLRDDDEEEQDDDVETSRLTAGIGTLHRNKDGDFVADGEGHAAGTRARAGGRVAIVGRGLTSRAEVGCDSEDSSVAAAIERRSRPQPPVKWCHKCDAFKPPRAHHCSLCRRCIVKMDHHCPWVNNCVGIGNQKLFLLFCIYTCALCMFALGIMGVEVVFLGDSLPKACQLDANGHVSTVALSAMALMFGLFTCGMACDQCQVATTNQTKIDRLKGEVHESSGESNEVFGGEDGDKCRCHWLIPVPARFPAGEAAARIFGYYCINRNGTLDGLGFAGGGSGETVATSGREGINSVIASRLDNMEMAEYGELSTVENVLEPRGDSAEAGRARHNGVDERDSGRGELAMSAV